MNNPRCAYWMALAILCPLSARAFFIAPSLSFPIKEVRETDLNIQMGGWSLIASSDPSAPGGAKDAFRMNDNSPLLLPAPTTGSYWITIKPQIALVGCYLKDGLLFRATSGIDKKGKIDESNLVARLDRSVDGFRFRSDAETLKPGQPEGTTNLQALLIVAGAHRRDTTILMIFRSVKHGDGKLSESSLLQWVPLRTLGEVLRTGASPSARELNRSFLRYTRTGGVTGMPSGNPEMPLYAQKDAQILPFAKVLVEYLTADGAEAARRTVPSISALILPILVKDDESQETFPEPDPGWTPTELIPLDRDYKLPNSVVKQCPKGYRWECWALLWLGDPTKPLWEITPEFLRLRLPQVRVGTQTAVDPLGRTVVDSNTGQPLEVDQTVPAALLATNQSGIGLWGRPDRRGELIPLIAGGAIQRVKIIANNQTMFNGLELVSGFPTSPNQGGAGRSLNERPTAACQPPRPSAESDIPIGKIPADAHK